MVEDGRVLVARRSRPAALAGLWEFPGGKVEPGETPTRAAVREILEELGCDIEVTGWLHGDSAIGDGLVLRIASARLIGGDPVPAEHDAVRWIRPERFGELTWADADLPFLDSVRGLLGAG